MVDMACAYQTSFTFWLDMIWNSREHSIHTRMQTDATMAKSAIAKLLSPSLVVKGDAIETVII